MPSASYSYIDVATLDAVRERFAAGEALAVLSVDLEQIIWTNGPGAALLGHADIGTAIGASSRLGFAAKRQIAATSGFPDIGSDRAIMVRLSSGMTSRAVAVLASGLTLPDGEKAILLAVPVSNAGSRSRKELAERAIGGFSEPGQFTALVGTEGQIEAASAGFAELGLDAGVISALAAEGRNEATRVVRRVIKGANGTLPAGLARLTDQPARYLLVVIDETEGNEPEAEAWAEQPVTASLALPPDDAPLGVEDIPLGAQDETPGDEAVATLDPGAGAEEEYALEAEAAPEPVDQPVDVADQPTTILPAPVPDDAPPISESVAPRTEDETLEPTAVAVPDPSASVDEEDMPEAAAPAPDGQPDEPGQHDRWYFREDDGQGLLIEDSEAAPDDGRQTGLNDENEPAAATEDGGGEEGTAEVRQPAEAPAQAKTPAPTLDRSAAPVRFVWRTDASGRFSMVSPEFASAVGAAAAGLVGRSFREVADAFKLDPDGEIAGLLDRRDTWSGRSVLWPVAGTDLKLPVDLAALPVYARDRSFEGFRGFGVARTADAVVDPEALGLNLATAFDSKTAASEQEPAQETAADETATGAASETPTPANDSPAAADPFKGEVPALSIVPKPERRFSDKVIRLAEHRPGAPDKSLSTLERSAFREIGERLRQDSPTAEPVADNDAAPSVEATADATADADPRLEAVEQTGGIDPEAPVTADPPADEPETTGETMEALGFSDDRDTSDDAYLAALDGVGVERVDEAGSTTPDEPAAATDDEFEHTVAVEPGQTPETTEETDEPALWTENQPGDTPVETAPAESDGADEFDQAASEAALDSEQAPVPASDIVGETEWQDETPERNVGPAANDQPEPMADEPLELTTATEADAEQAPPVGSEAPQDQPAEAVAETGDIEASDAFENGDAVEDSTADATVAEEVSALSDEVPREQTAGASAEAGDIAASEALDGSDGDAEDSALEAGEVEAFDTKPETESLDSEDESVSDDDAVLDNRPAHADTSILDKLPVPVLIHAGDRLHHANAEFLSLTGYDNLDEITAAGGLEALFSTSDTTENGEPDRQMRLIARHGREIPVDAHLRSVPWNGGKALMLVVRPSAEAPREAAPLPNQPAIADMQARIAEMRTIIDTATDGVVLIAPDGAIRSISRPAEALFGFDSDEVAGKPFASLFAIESQRAARDYLNGLSDHGVASVLNDGREVIGREAQGRFIPLFMTIGKLPGDSGYCAVVRDITQWKRAEEDLTQARALAERASSQKSEFLARISHEIRTPLNAIIGFSELMIDEKFGPVANDRYRDYLRDINRSGNHVLDLVNDLLDISKIEAGQQEMSYEAVSLNDTLAETVAMMQPQANRERVIIRSSFASKLPEVVADLRSVRQIALNILSNAVRYTQAGGQVIVSTSYEAAGDVVMRVRDTGIGMSSAEIEQALKPFKQINALKRGRHDGTGLGLPLTKAMVEANRAKFMILSTPGEGTLVEITFPSTRVLAE